MRMSAELMVVGLSIIAGFLAGMVVVLLVVLVS